MGDNVQNGHNLIIVVVECGSRQGSDDDGGFHKRNLGLGLEQCHGADKAIDEQNCNRGEHRLPNVEQRLDQARAVDFVHKSNDIPIQVQNEVSELTSRALAHKFTVDKVPTLGVLCEDQELRLGRGYSPAEYPKQNFERKKLTRSIEGGHNATKVKGIT